MAHAYPPLVRSHLLHNFKDQGWETASVYHLACDNSCSFVSRSTFPKAHEDLKRTLLEPMAAATLWNERDRVGPTEVAERRRTVSASSRIFAACRCISAARACLTARIGGVVMRRDPVGLSR